MWAKALCIHFENPSKSHLKTVPSLFVCFKLATIMKIMVTSFLWYITYPNDQIDRHTDRQTGR